MGTVLVRAVSAVVLAIVWLLCWDDIVFAGSLPGEGFTAALLALLGFSLQAVVLGHAVAVQRLPPRIFLRVFLFGMVLLLVLMAAPLTWGDNLFEAFKISVGPWRVSSTLLFDLSLFTVVSGGMLSTFTSLRKEVP